MMTPAAPALMGEAAKDHPLPDEDVVQRVLGGETHLYEVLMRRHNRKVHAVVRSILRREHEVEEVMQQAYVSAWLHLRQFRGESSFSTWLVRIAVHEALARTREDRRSAGEEHVVDLPARGRSPEESASDREIGALLRDAVDRLPPSHRAVFVLRDVEQVGTAETAACLGLSEENVKVQLHRARRRLRADLTASLRVGLDALYPFHAVRCDRVAARVLMTIASLDTVPH